MLSPAGRETPGLFLATGSGPRPGPPPSYLLAIGPLANTLMFIVISVPLIERRQNQNKPEYAGYMADTGMLLPKLPAVMRALQK